MKQILSFLLFLLPALAFAQWPAAPNKIRLGNQTTGDGLIVRTDSIPNWTPATNRDAWVAFDTVAGVLYYYEGGVWNSFAGGDGNGLFDAANEGDTLLVNTAILSDLGLTLESQDGYTTVDITPGQLKFSVEHSNFRINEQEVEIVASGATAISALENHLILFPDTIELSNHLPENNSLTRIVGIDDVTNRLGYIERDSIQTGGGSGTVTSISQGVGIVATPNPITTTGTVSVDTATVVASKMYVTTRGYTTGSGTLNTIAKWTPDGTTLGNSLITDDGARVSVGGTAGLVLPSGTEEQRSGEPVEGEVRQNTSTGFPEIHTSGWNPFQIGARTNSYIPFGANNGQLQEDSTFSIRAANNSLMVRKVASAGTIPAITVGRVNGAYPGLVANPFQINYFGGDAYSMTWSNQTITFFAGGPTTFSGAIRFPTSQAGWVSQNNRIGYMQGVELNAAGTRIYKHIFGQSTVPNTNSNISPFIITLPSREIINPPNINNEFITGVIIRQTLTADSSTASPVKLQALDLSPSFQSNGFQAIAYGIRYRPSSLSSVINHYAITTTSGNVGFRTETPQEALHVVGRIRSDSLNATAESLAGWTGTSGPGVATRVTLGSGLSLSGGTLSATGPEAAQYAYMYVAGSFADTIGTTARKINFNQIGTTSGTETSSFDIDTTSIRFIGDGATIEVSATWNGAVGSSGDFVRLYITKNGTKIASTEVYAFFSGGTIPQTLYMHPAVVSAANNDIFEVRAESVVNTLTYTTYMLNLTAKKL